MTPEPQETRERYADATREEILDALCAALVRFDYAIDEIEKLQARLRRLDKHR